MLDGDDPIEMKRKKRDEAKAQTAERMIFRDAVAKFLEVHQNTWKNEKHRQQWANTLRDYAKPLRDRPISAIDGASDHRGAGADLDREARDCAKGKAAH